MCLEIKLFQCASRKQDYFSQLIADKKTAYSDGEVPVRLTISMKTRPQYLLIRLSEHIYYLVHICRRRRESGRGNEVLKIAAWSCWGNLSLLFTSGCTRLVCWSVALVHNAGDWCCFKSYLRRIPQSSEYDPIEPCTYWSTLISVCVWNDALRGPVKQLVGYRICGLSRIVVHLSGGCRRVAVSRIK